MGYLGQGPSTTQIDGFNRGEIFDLFVGMIASFGSTEAPDLWLECDGSAVSRTTYSKLFARVGTTWGAGDGSTTFNVPDLRAAVPQGSGAGTGAYRNGVDATDGYYGDDVNSGAGLNVGEERRDRMQGHAHRIARPVSSSNALDGVNSDFVLATVGAIPSYEYALARANGTTDDITAGFSGRPYIDGDNGDPRTGSDTQVYSKGVLYCILAGV